MASLPTTLIVVLSCIGASPQTTRKLRRPGYLPTLARNLLDTRMDKQGHNVMALVAAVVLLEYDDAQAAAQNIADEPGISRVPAGDDTLNASLPRCFFDFQDELRERAKALVEATRTHDDAQIAAAYARMTQTCIACHATYLHGRDPPSGVSH